MRQALFSTYAQSVASKLKYIPGNAIYLTYYTEERPTNVTCGYDLFHRGLATCEFATPDQDAANRALQQTKQLCCEVMGCQYAEAEYLPATAEEHDYLSQANTAGYMDAGWAIYNQYPMQIHRARTWFGNYYLTRSVPD